MATTVTIDESTHRLLKQMKKRRDAKSFNELFKKMAEKDLEVPSTDEMFGSAKIENKEDIRDRSDRIDRYE